MKAIAMKTARLLIYTILVVAFVLPAGALQGVAPIAIAPATDDTFLAEPVAAKPNLEPALARPAQEQAAGERLAALKRQHGHAPNIILVFMDDVGWGDPGIYGGGIAVGAATPNMDRLAREGLQLMNTHSQPSCTPTRATSDRATSDPHRNAAADAPRRRREQPRDRPEDNAAAEAQGSGILTRAVGKWHLGAFKDAQPQNVGFDHYFGILTSSDDYTAWREPGAIPT